MKVIYKGKAVEVPDSHGRLLIQSGRAKPSAEAEREQAPVGTQKGVEPTEQTAMTSRTYKRRDMAADDSKSTKAKD